LRFFSDSAAFAIFPSLTSKTDRARPDGRHLAGRLQQRRDDDEEAGTMIPNWQWAIIAILIAAMFAAGVYSSPNSFAYLVLTSQCDNTPSAPIACRQRFSGATR
jgi:hypothetical protein